MYPNVCSTNLDTNPDISESGAELEDGDLGSSKDLINHVCDLASDSSASTSGLFFEKKIHSFKGYNMKLFQRNNAAHIIQSPGKKMHDNYIPNSLFQLLIMRFERILTSNLAIRFVVIWRELVYAIK